MSAICLIVAFILFILAAVSVPAPPRVNWIGLGLAIFVLSFLVGRFQL